MLFFIESPLCINSKYEFFIASAHNAAVLPVIPLTASYTIPVTISVLTPGVAVHAPVAASCVKDAAGTVT